MASKYVMGKDPSQGPVTRSAAVSGKKEVVGVGEDSPFLKTLGPGSGISRQSPNWIKEMMEAQYNTPPVTSTVVWTNVTTPGGAFTGPRFPSPSQVRSQITTSGTGYVTGTPGVMTSRVSESNTHDNTSMVGGDVTSLILYLERKEEMRRQDEERKEEIRRQEEERKEEIRRQEEMELRQLERERFELLAQSLAQRPSREESPAARLPTFAPPRLTLPELRPGDDVDDFLDHFEAVADSYNMAEETRSLYLISSLTGKAREAFNNLPPESSYTDLKAALRRQFRISPEAYRKKFREIRKAGSESFIQFGIRLKRTLEHWETMSGMALRDLILIEQLLSTVTDDLAVCIRDEGLRTFQEVIERAERFAEARRGIRVFKTSAGSLGGGLKSSPMPKRGNLSYSQHPLAEQSPYSVVPPRGSMASAPKSATAPGKGGNQCFYCGDGGHYKRDCPKLKRDRRQQAAVGHTHESCALATVPVFSAEQQGDQGEMGPTCSVFLSLVEDRIVDSIRDSGATCTFVDESVVPPDAEKGGTCQVTGVEKSFNAVRPYVKVQVATPYFKGAVWAVALRNPAYTLLIGNNVLFADGTRQGVSTQLPREVLAAVTTRAMARDQAPVLQPTQGPVTDAVALHTDRETVRRLQARDHTLQQLRQATTPNINTEREGKASYTMHDGLLFRVFHKNGEHLKQLVVPLGLRRTVLSLGHDIPMAGHLGVRRTQERVWQHFYWPGMCKDVRQYCRSCDVCQRTSPRGKNQRVPLGTVPLVSEPFQKVGVDIVGPITPASARGNRYILVVVDYATRYPEAVALKGIDSVTVADALWQMWTRVGVPSEVLTDRGTQFTSDVMAQVNRLLGIHGRTTTPYHAQANGLVERFNATLKKMIQRLCIEKPKDWDLFIPAVLFAFREVPQESLRFSPFELLYGRTVRGPMALLRQLWTKEASSPPETLTEVEYVVDLRNRLEETCRLARENLQQAATKYKRQYDKKARERWFEVGDEVLLLLPEKKNKLQIAWQGPYRVIERVGDWDYRIAVKGTPRLYHANLLKRYTRREECSAAVAPVVIEETEDDHTGSFSSQGIPLLPLQAEETWKDVSVHTNLTSSQKQEIMGICQSASGVLTDLPLRCTVGECELVLEDITPVRVRQYPLPHSQYDVIREEVQSMLKMGVIEPATSPYSAPIVLVKKKDGKVRFCVDFRRLNRVLRFDAEPLPDVNQIFAKLSHAKYFSKLDLAKGYWQIPMKESDRPKTAFTTPQGQFQWLVMPFGLKTAGAIFSRIMRRVLGPLQLDDAHNFMDDLLLATGTWNRHTEVLQQILCRLQEVQLSARPTKCQLGCPEISFLGHHLQGGQLHPEQDKVAKIREAHPPATKKELRAFLGLAGYYRRFVPKFSETALPLTNKTKGSEPNKVLWSDECQKAFDKLKEALINPPVLVLPDPSKTFVLRTDASGLGLGAVLLQDHGEGLQPIAFASKKLSGAEQRYHTIEQEALAVVWGIRKFYPYLYGRHFVLESDHHPLKYLHRIRPVSRRLMGWAVELQSHSFTFRHIKGVDNLGADYLSRTGQ
ncbi:uncharacterized protein LOC143286993 [Babylonia areolata]|uniref:uncharacterized protein LOC143286993 n=1 Tax=Babylonia areolata TaxID=304850 RepID=UPI003FD59794